MPRIWFGVLSVLATLVTLHAPQAAPVPKDYKVSTQGFDVTLKSGPSAKIYTFAYVRPGTATAQRPIIFAWNGGPGSASTYLHFGILGPKRIMFPQPHEKPKAEPVMDNTLTLLDAADLVFIDPVGTGYSQSNDDKAFYDTDADAEATVDVIQDWLRANGRLASPVYLVGESYGGSRLAVATHYLDDPSRSDINLAGLVMISQSITNEVADHSETPNILSYAESLPALTRVAVYHGVVKASNPAALEQEVRKFAGGEYLEDLFQGRDLPQAQQAALAERLERYTGISKDYFLAHGLGITKDAFRQKLLESKGLVLTRNDSRYAGPAGSKDPMMDLFKPSFDSIAEGEIAKLPKPNPDAHYKSLATDIGGNWRFGASSGERATVRYIEHAMTARPALKLIIVSGNYDLGAAQGVAAYIMRHSNLDKARTTLLFYDAGHMVYSDPACAADFSQKLHTLVAAH